MLLKLSAALLYDAISWLQLKAERNAEFVGVVKVTLRCDVVDGVEVGDGVEANEEFVNIDPGEEGNVELVDVEEQADESPNWQAICEATGSPAKVVFGGTRSYKSLQLLIPAALTLRANFNGSTKPQKKPAGHLAPWHQLCVVFETLQERPSQGEHKQSKGK